MSIKLRNRILVSFKKHLHNVYSILLTLKIKIDEKKTQWNTYMDINILWGKKTNAGSRRCNYHQSYDRTSAIQSLFYILNILTIRWWINAESVMHRTYPEKQKCIYQFYHIQYPYCLAYKSRLCFHAHASTTVYVAKCFLPCHYKCTVISTNKVILVPGSLLWFKVVFPYVFCINPFTPRHLYGMFQIKAWTRYLGLKGLFTGLLQG